MSREDNQSIWYELLYAGIDNNLPHWLSNAIADPIYFEGTIKVLIKYCFVEVQWTTKSYSMHACVHDWTLARLNKIVDSNSYWFAFDCVAHSVDRWEWESLGHFQCARLAPHAARLAHDRFIKAGLLNDIAIDRIEKVESVAQLLLRQGQLAAAEVTFRRALAGREKISGRDHPSTLYTVNSLGDLYRDQGRLDEAEQMYIRALAGYKDAFGPDDIWTLNTANTLGNLYRDQGELDKANEMFERAEGKPSKH